MQRRIIKVDEKEQFLAMLRETCSETQHKFITALASQQEDIRVFRSECEEDILGGLIWHAICETRILTPFIPNSEPRTEQPRTMLHVARRFHQEFGTFENASYAESINSRVKYDPNWFKPCLLIARSFDFSRFGYVFVREPKRDEEAGNRDTGRQEKLYVWDGCHRLLVLAVKVLFDPTFDLKPINLIRIEKEVWHLLK